MSNDAWLNEVSNMANRMAKRDEAAKEAERAELERQQKLHDEWIEACRETVLPEFKAAVKRYNEAGVSAKVAMRPNEDRPTEITLTIQGASLPRCVLSVAIELDRDSRFEPVRVSGIPVREGLSREFTRDTHYVALELLDPGFVRRMIGEFLGFVETDQLD